MASWPVEREKRIGANPQIGFPPAFEVLIAPRLVERKKAKAAPAPLRESSPVVEQR
jgi:hypothetical protein